MALSPIVRHAIPELPPRKRYSYAVRRVFSALRGRSRGVFADTLPAMEKRRRGCCHASAAASAPAGPHVLARAL